MTTLQLIYSSRPFGFADMALSGMLSIARREQCARRHQGRLDLPRGSNGAVDKASAAEVRAVFGQIVKKPAIARQL